MQMEPSLRGRGILPHAKAPRGRREFGRGGRDRAHIAARSEAGRWTGVDVYSSIGNRSRRRILVGIWVLPGLIQMVLSSPYFR